MLLSHHTPNSSHQPHTTNPSKPSRSSRPSHSTNSSHSSHTSPTSPGLPSEEYRTLRKRQDRTRLESHFTQTPKANTSRNPTAPRPTAYQTAHLPTPDRIRISTLQNATRRALGPNLAFTDASLEQAQRPAAPTTPRRAAAAEHPRNPKSTLEAPIPRRFVAGFNGVWAADHGLDDAEQARADCMLDAPWRVHADMPADVALVDAYAWPQKRASRADSAVSGVWEGGVDADGCESEGPWLVSKFSTESLVFEAKSRRRVFGF